MATTNRIAYYDVMKGILICMVILGHVTYETLIVASIHNDFIANMRSIQWWFVSFFMPAFFVITGICSNFNKPLRPFFISCLKTILIPGLIFDFLFFTIPQLSSSGDCIEVLINFARRFLSRGGYYWFLVSLFCAKLLFWNINNMGKGWIKLTILLSLFASGFIIHHYQLFYNYWSICQTLDLTIFIAFGQLLRNPNIPTKSLIRIGFLLFILIILCKPFLDFKMPYIAAGYNIHSWSMLIIHLVTSICGTMATLAICQKINHNMVLEYLGRGSLVIYMTHFSVMKFLLSHWGTLLDHADLGTSIILTLLLFLITLGVSTAFVWIFQQKHLRILIGKW